MSTASAEAPPDTDVDLSDLDLLDDDKVHEICGPCNGYIRGSATDVKPGTVVTTLCGKRWLWPAGCTCSWAECLDCRAIWLMVHARIVSRLPCGHGVGA